MFEFQISERWKKSYPDACAGVLVLHGVTNGEPSPALQKWVQGIEEDLKACYAGWDRTAIGELPVIRAYNAYYRRFKKTYHVQLQLESVVIRGRSLPRGPALLEAMFSAELKNQLLTAGHDLSSIIGTVKLDAAQGDEVYQTLSGESKTLKTGDMFLADEMGVISSVIYGPDGRTRLSATTRNALFTVYAPGDISQEAVLRHLEDIRAGVLLASPGAQFEMLKVFSDI
jgi:DNA/RNA-binding domain of Phe-tRNA-synthetase-like protein